MGQFKYNVFITIIFHDVSIKCINMACEFRVAAARQSCR